MNINKCIKESFVVIGKEGSTEMGDGFIPQLWLEANSNFKEIESLAKKDEDGKLIGIWGIMSDMSHSFKMWEDNFSKGLYLAGVECQSDAEAPKGWTKWVVPGFEYLCVEVEGSTTFPLMIEHLTENNIQLVGAIHDYTDPKTGTDYMYFPIRKL